MVSISCLSASNDFEGELQRYRVYMSDTHSVGDLEFLGTDAVDIKIDETVVGPLVITRFVTKSRLGFRRTWQHIRANQRDTYVIVFARRGTMKVSRSDSAYGVGSGFLTITRSTAPMYTEACPGDGGEYESIQAIVPAHLFQQYFPAGAPSPEAIPTTHGDGLIAEKILNLLACNAGEVGEEIVDALTAAFLKAVGSAFRQVGGKAIERRVTVADRRFAEIESYVWRHLTEPGLSLSSIATHCGISTRYLCHLLKTNGTSFSDLVWCRRLEKTREWLLSPHLRHCNISEIARMAGYKSAPHFTRMFHRKFGYAPKQFRAMAQHEGLRYAPTPDPAEPIQRSA